MFTTESHWSVADADLPGWWAVYTRHHHEESARKILEGKGLDVFLPVFETVRQWKDRKKRVLMPLFPCYLFVRATPTAGRLPVLTTPGVNLIITHGEQCVIISDDEIRSIRQTAQDPTRIEPHPYLAFGERVRVVRGAMAGVEGILVRKKGPCRLVVSVDLLNQSAAVEVNENDVAPVSIISHAVLHPTQPQRQNDVVCFPAWHASRLHQNILPQ